MTGHVKTARLIHIFFISHSRRSLLCVNMQGVLSRVFLAYVCDFQRAYPRARSRRGALINLSCRGERKRERKRDERERTSRREGGRGGRNELGERRAARRIYATAHEGAQPGGGIVCVRSIGSLTSTAVPRRIELSAACLATRTILSVANHHDFKM